MEAVQVHPEMPTTELRQGWWQWKMDLCQELELIGFADPLFVRGKCRHDTEGSGASN